MSFRQRLVCEILAEGSHCCEEGRPGPVAQADPLRAQF